MIDRDALLLLPGLRPVGHILQSLSSCLLVFLLSESGRHQWESCLQQEEQIKTSRIGPVLGLLPFEKAVWGLWLQNAAVDAAGPEFWTAQTKTEPKQWQLFVSHIAKNQNRSLFCRERQGLFASSQVCKEMNCAMRLASSKYEPLKAGRSSGT